MNPVLALLIYLANGLLAVAFFAADYAAQIALLPALVWLAVRAVAAQRPWAIGAGLLALLAALLTPAPVPLLLPAMAWAGLAAIRFERFNPDRLRWRILAGLALYAAAALAFTAYSAYANSLSAAVWSATFASGEAGDVFAQGRPYLTTLAAIALWVGLPGAYFGLLLQSLLAHPPSPSSPAELTHSIRSGSSREAHR